MEKVCCICNEVIREEVIEHNGKYYCEECAEEVLSTCKHCKEVGLKDYMYYVDDDYYCESCYDNLFVTCEECQEPISRDDAYYYDGTPYCEECYANNFTRCAGCDNDYPNDETYYDDNTDCYYCEDCYRNLTNNIINDYQSMTIENLSYIRSSLPESNTELISMYDNIINTLTTIVNEMAEELEDIDREER